jgi:inhibitor of cysteine peptidase
VVGAYPNLPFPLTVERFLMPCNHLEAVFALGLVALVGGSLAAAPQEKGTKGKTVTVAETDKEKTVKLAKGDTLELKLGMRSGTGFTWVVGKGDDAKLKPLGKPVTEKPNKPVPGGPVTQVFRFEAAAEGKARLEMWYKRPFEKEKEPARKFIVSVEIK